MHWAHFLLQMMPSCLGRMALLLSVALLTVVRAGDMNEMRASSFRERHWRKRIDRAARVRTLSLSPISDSVAPRYRVGADDNSGTLEKAFTPVVGVLQSSVKAAFNSAIGKYSNGMGHPPVHCNPYDQMYANRHKGKRRSADIKRTYARNFRSEEEKEDDETDGMSFVPGGKKYKEVVSGSKEINSPIPVNVKEFENIPVDNDIHQDLSNAMEAIQQTVTSKGCG